MMNKDLNELIFRCFFCSIFVGLGAEHIFSDALIQHLMPEWVENPRLTSIVVGIILISGGGLIFMGYQLKWASIILSVFIIGVTFTVHLPALFSSPKGIPAEWDWVWIILQRSNFVKNVCLLGVLIHLYHHPPGRYSFDYWMKKKALKK